MKNDRKVFEYFEFDMNSILPIGWNNDILNVANNYAKYKMLVSNSITSREKYRTIQIEALTVDGVVIKKHLPWLYDLYKSDFYELGKQCVKENLYLARDDLYAINLNIQKGTKMRYECHIDSNPLQGVFYATSHDEKDGGELVVSNNPNALGIDEIDLDCKVIYPKKGFLYLFNAYYNPHYVRPLKSSNGCRVSCPMNFYTDSSPESDRPMDLSKHLF